MDQRMKRLYREIQEIKKDRDSGISIETVDERLDHLIGTFSGPEGTSYAKGRFEVDIQAPVNYPFAPLNMKFLTKVYHPNVSSASGAICLDILKQSWSPVYTLRTCIVSLQSLLSTPEPDDPQDAVVAKHYLASRESFEATAAYWTEVYAKPGNAKIYDLSVAESASLAGIDLQHVLRFTQMGFPAEKVITVLKTLNYRGSNTAQINEDTIVRNLCE